MIGEMLEMIKTFAKSNTQLQIELKKRVTREEFQRILDDLHMNDVTESHNQEL